MILPSPPAIADTYSPPSYAESWECVEDYQRVLEFAANHPELGSSAISSRLDIPRSRVRPWMNGSRPDVVKGIQTAEQNGWTSSSTDNQTTKAIVELAGWALSGGSIRIGANSFVFFTVPEHLTDEFDRIATDANLQYELIREDEPSRATEARVNEDVAVLARVLYAMGVPEGGKSEEGPVSLPEFVSELDDELRAAFVRIYVLNRGAEHENKDTLTIREERPESYLKELTELLREVANGPVTRAGKTITISADAARSILEESRASRSRNP